ncbi:MAG: hypothetical protein ACREMA_20120, partial [Longimicrobiales bacterium]
DNSVAKSNVAVVLTRLGKSEEAAKIYNELLAQDLSAEDFFSVGVGLFKATQHAPAAQAFRKTIARNPYQRDAHYNLAQSLYSLVMELVEQKTKATGAAAKPIETKLVELNTELATVTEKLRTIDPANRNVIALQSRAYRALADLTTIEKVAAEWKNKTLEVLKANESLIFTVEDVMLTKNGDETQIAGNIVNQKGTAGQPVKLRFDLLGADGTTIGNQEVTVALPAVQGASAFKVALKPGESVLGWRYEIVQ